MLAWLIALALLYIVVLSVVFAALNTIFRTGTYLYATTGQAPPRWICGCCSPPSAPSYGGRVAPVHGHTA
ncbi:hypothetical protein C6A85_000000107210, partial [Mycobacterium sp. ITM-2017-0098]